MIFLTVGAQMPFDRLVAAVDDWAGTHPDVEVVAQVGDTTLVPRNLTWVARLEPVEFRRLVRDAGLVVSHAGMGTILTALELQTPILVMPRRGSLRETRNDHQVATAEWFAAQGRIAVALDEDDLVRQLGQLDQLTSAYQISRWASDTLLEAVRDFIGGDAGSTVRRRSSTTSQGPAPHDEIRPAG